jgi:hypothetical protein
MMTGLTGKVLPRARFSIREGMSSHMITRGQKPSTALSPGLALHVPERRQTTFRYDFRRCEMFSLVVCFIHHCSLLTRIPYEMTRYHKYEDSPPLSET